LGEEMFVGSRERRVLDFEQEVMMMVHRLL
jgi:hypothetical protein